MSIQIDRRPNTPFVSRIGSEFQGRMTPWIQKTIPKIAEFAGLTFGHLFDREPTTTALPDVLVLGAERLAAIHGPYILAILGTSRLLEDDLINHIVLETTGETTVYLTPTVSADESKIRRHVRTLLIDPFMVGIRKRYQIASNSVIDGLRASSPILMHTQMADTESEEESYLNSRIAEIALARNIPIVPVYIDRSNNGQLSNYVSQTYVSFGQPIDPANFERTSDWSGAVDTCTRAIAEGIFFVRTVVKQHILYHRFIAKTLDAIAREKALLGVSRLSIEEASQLQVPDDQLDKIQQVFFRELWIQELIRTLNERFDQLFGLKEEPAEDSAHHSPRELQMTTLRLIQMTDTEFGATRL